MSMPWPRTKPPRQPGPRRWSASSDSSTTDTSQPSLASPFATADPTRPHPMTTAFTAGQVTPRTRPRGTRRRAPRTALGAGRSRRSERRSAIGAASVRRTRRRSGPRSGTRPPRGSRVRSSAPARRPSATSTPWSRPSARASSSVRSTFSATSGGSSPSSGYLRGTRTTVNARTSPPLSFAIAIAVATISSPMSPSFIGTRMRPNSGAGGSSSTGATCSRSPCRVLRRTTTKTTRPARSHSGPA